MRNLHRKISISARERRIFHLIVFFIWLIPGALLSIFFAHSLAWIVFMSWFACVYAAASAYSAETPVEREEDEEAD